MPPELLEAGEAGRTGPVTVVISRRVRTGREADYEQWLEGILREINRFPGYLGTNILRPDNPTRPEFVAILRFDSYENLERWEHSDVRRDWLARTDAIADDTHPLQRLDGLEFWFTPPASAALIAPSRHKMSSILIFIVFVIGMTISPQIRLALGRFPVAVQVLAVSAFQVILLTYFVMPAITKILARWLFPKTSR